MFTNLPDRRYFFERLESMLVAPTTPESAEQHYRRHNLFKTRFPHPGFLCPIKSLAKPSRHIDKYKKFTPVVPQRQNGE